MSSIIIRKAYPEDADAMREVQRLTWLATYPNEAYGITIETIEARFRDTPEERREWQHFVSTPPLHSWVALEETDVIGFCTVKQDEHENRILIFYVLPAYQNKGIGKRLMQTVLGWFGNEQEIILDVVSYNERAIAFYHTFGFVSNGPVRSSEALQLSSETRFPEIYMVKKRHAN